MATIGESLKQRREELRLTIEEVSRRTKIHVDAIKALEDDKHEGVSPVYIKGFLKIYSRLLCLDEKDLLRQYSILSKEEQATFHFDKTDKAAELSAPPGLDISASPRKDLRPVIILAIKLSGVLAAVLFAFFLPFKIVDISQGQVGVRSASKNQDKKTGLKSSFPPVKGVIPLAKKDSLNLSVLVTVDSWVKVKLDGKTVFQDILKRGKTENWKAKSRIELSLGNAGAAEIEINGKHISGLGRKGQMVNAILITKDGIYVPN